MTKIKKNHPLIMICAPDTDVTKNSYDGCSWTAGHAREKKKKKKKKRNLLLLLFIIIYY